MGYSSSSQVILYLSLVLEGSSLVEFFTLQELLESSFFIERMELGVLPTNREANGPILCALFVLPFDSSQACSFASISTFSFGVCSF